jgi:FkbH-like protein
MIELEYPYKSEDIIKQKRKIKKELLDAKKTFIDVKIALLAGSTINELKDILEIFLLNYGIKPEFYLSEYNKYYEDAVFDNPELENFNPDIVYIFTSARNIIHDFDLSTSAEKINAKLDTEYNKYFSIWENIKKKYKAVIIQNNFEYPSYRLLGNKDISDIHGLSNFLTRLNGKFYEYAEDNQSFFICDINYIASNYGLSRWHSDKLYALYKLPCDVMAFPDIAYNVSNIIKSIYGKNKKALAVDLDNTLWGGVISEDGEENVKVGPEIPEGEIYLDFQKYIKKLKSLGVLLNVVSKNDEEIAISGLKNTDGVLKPDDFIKIKANWEPKSDNIIKISKELKLGADAFAFIDDNPMERDIVKKNVSEIGVVNVSSPENYIRELDRSGFFEVTNVTKEDIDKTKQYKEMQEREDFKNSFLDYTEYLKSLDMKAEINAFEEKYYDRISQLSNKSNQFNLTTKRYTVEDIKNVSEDKNYITLYGKLIDKFGDNGIVSLVVGRIRGNELNLELFLMSCRVLKREMEYKMLDALVEKCRDIGVDKIKAKFIKTEKNSMVKNLLADFGFTKLKEDEHENSEWELSNLQNYTNKCKVIS